MMKVLVVFETMFGNTEQIARAIGDGLSKTADVMIRNAKDAPTTIPVDVDALVVGAPTHVFSMPRHVTREDAVRRGADDEDVSAGLREWLHALPKPAGQLPFAAFDTRAIMAIVPGAASHAATRVARRRGFHVLEPMSFYVAGYEGPLISGEAERARTWGEDLGRIFAMGELAVQ